MGLSNSNVNKYPEYFILTGLLLLICGLIFGLTGALQYIIPGFLKSIISFEKIRPMHVSSVVFWIIFGAVGSVYGFLQQYTGRSIYSTVLTKVQFYTLVATVGCIFVTYIKGIFGGREYWEFNPLLALPIIMVWLLFIYNVYSSIVSFKNQPVFVWMWVTGIVFFLFTFLESYLWIFPYFSDNVVNDMTIQWKSYGSMVGSWNMQIYGCSIFLMTKIGDDKTYGHSKKAFILYFIGLFNLLFNWGHHIYTLPTHFYVQYVSYAVSMTELLIFGSMIWTWRTTLNKARKHINQVQIKFLISADIWVFLTLLLAIAMSVPAINLFTHGTHVTVAHTMGATIGVNSFLLLAFAFDLLSSKRRFKGTKLLNFGLGLTNISLVVFWITLIVAGVLKAYWQWHHKDLSFTSVMLLLKPYFIVFFISGFALSLGFILMLIPLIKNYFHLNPDADSHLT